MRARLSKFALAAALALLGAVAPVEAWSPWHEAVLFGGPAPAAFGFYNFTGRNLPHWKAALAAVAAGSHNAKVLLVGDSTTDGYGAESTASQDRANSWPTQLAGLFKPPTPAGWQSFIGDGPGAMPTTSLDARVTSNFSQNTGLPSVGGAFMQATSAATFSFTPATSCDTFDVYATDYPGSGTLNANLDGGTNTAINENGSSSMTTTTITGSLGPHTLNVSWASGGTTNLLGVDCYNSAQKQIMLWNAGWWGSFASDWDSSTYFFNPLPAIEYLAPSLTIIDLTINDWNSATNLTTYTNELQAIISAAQQSGDVILMSGNPTNQSASAATQATYDNAVKALAYADGIPFIDIYNLLGANWTTLNNEGLMYDTDHPEAALYSRIAGYVYQALKPGFRSAQ